MSSLSFGRLVDTEDPRPLTEQEQRAVQRLLSDPFSFPMEFKTWLISYLETNPPQLPASSIFGLKLAQSAGALSALPAGIILPFGGNSPPSGALMCDGALYSKTDKKRLYDAIGDLHNVGGEPADQFRVPNIQDRVPVGKGTQPESNTVGQKGGAKTTSHGHSYSFSTSDYVGTYWDSYADSPGNPKGAIASHYHTGSGTTSNADLSTLQPFIVVNFIIVS